MIFGRFVKRIQQSADPAHLGHRMALQPTRANNLSVFSAGASSELPLGMRIK